MNSKDNEESEYEDLDDVDENIGELVKFDSKPKTKKRKIRKIRKTKSTTILQTRFLNSIKTISNKIQNNESVETMNEFLKSSLNLKSDEDCFKIIQFINDVGIKQSQKIEELKAKVNIEDISKVSFIENGCEKLIDNEIDEITILQKKAFEKYNYYFLILDLLNEIKKLKKLK